MFVNDSFWYIQIGQFIIGLAVPIILNSQLAFINTWYDESSRGVFIALIGLTNPIGTCIGFVLPSVFITKYDEQKKTRESCWFFLFYN